IFQALWDDLDQKLTQAKQVKIANPTQKRRSERDLLEEVLERVRAIEMDRRRFQDSDNNALISINRLKNYQSHSPSAGLEKAAIADLPLSERAKSILFAHGIFHLLDLL